jgi:hypothetical protein
LWPYYDFFANALKISDGTMSTTWDYTATRNYLYSDIIMRIGPALAALPILAIYLIKKKYSCLALLCVCAAGIYTAGFFLRISLAERFIFVVVFSLQILSGRYTCEFLQSMRRGKASALQTVSAAIMALLLAAGITGQALIIFEEYIRPDFSTSSHVPFLVYHDPTAMHKQFADYMRADDIVFSDVPTSWAIPLYTGAKVVSLFHTPTHVHDNDARKAEVSRFYDPSLDNLQRLLILKHFKATKLVVYFPVAGQEIRNQITSMGLPLIFQSNELCIFDVPAKVDSPAPTGPRHD